MRFIWPIWLAGLVPWTALVIWLLLELRRKVRVPFLALWPPVEAPPRRRGLRPPGLALSAALLGLLLAVLAAARPQLNLPAGHQQPPLSIVLDRGLTMSARQDGQLRFARLARELHQAMLPLVGRNAPVTLHVIPGQRLSLDSGNWLQSVLALGPTAVDTQELLPAALAGARLSGAQTVIAISDRQLANSESRFVQVAPVGSVDNVAITVVAARKEPRPQVMVGISSSMALSQAALQVDSDGARARQLVTLPQAGRGTYFLDLPRLGDVVEAHIDVADAIGADNSAYLVLAQPWPKLEARGSLPPEMQRMLGVYASQQPPGAASRIVTISADQPLAAGETGIRLAPAGTLQAQGPAKVTQHPVTEAIDWSAVLRDARLAPAPAGEDWTTLVAAGSAAAVAIRTEPAPQIWCGISSHRWPMTPQYVMFWKNALDWLGQGTGQYSAQATGQLGGGWRALMTRGGQETPAGWWPGVYANGWGGRVAVNAPPAGPMATSVPDWRQHLQSVLGDRPGGREIGQEMMLAAVALGALSILLWPRRRLMEATATSEARPSRSA
jgi:hypothetical protein